MWTVRGSLSVRAYYAVAPTQLNRADGLSRSMSAGYTSVPAYLVARLAVDLELQGRGLGAELLLDALELVVEAAELGGGRLVVVDAIDEMARAFYEHHGFTRIGGSDRLVIKVATVADVLRRSKRL
ncbi:GNAT family N-acetyltransferase [Georgenia sp. M64]|uniref:GNAT family N-acetyltransferase n=1 Tax=Georgenia sp. M64 TaxID=3120520 RepID=UPI0030E36AFB